jgi:hypothetical protein
MYITINIKWLVVLSILLIGGSVLAQRLSGNRAERLAAINIPDEYTQANNILTMYDKSMLIKDCIKVANTNDDEIIINADNSIQNFIPTTTTLVLNIEPPLDENIE